MTTTPFAHESQVMAEINITPFTDVLLVLLIILMILAALATPPGFQKQLGREPLSHRHSDSRDRPVSVVVSAADRISLDGRPVGFAWLYRAMAATIARHDALGQSRHIMLVADAQASYNTIIKILDAARQAGDEDVGFVTR